MDERAERGRRIVRFLSFLLAAPVIVVSLASLVHYATSDDGYPFGTELGSRYRSGSHYVGFALAELGLAALLLLWAWRAARGPAVAAAALLVALLLLS